MHNFDTRFYHKTNLIGPVTSIDMYFITMAPPERQDYLTFIMPFDFYTWALTLASVVGVSTGLILNDKVERTWLQEPSKKSIFMSKCPYFKAYIALIQLITNFIFQVLHLPLELLLMRPRIFLLRKKPITSTKALVQKLKY